MIHSSKKLIEYLKIKTNGVVDTKNTKSLFLRLLEYVIKPE